jgi:hypothetical protein
MANKDGTVKVLVLVDCNAGKCGQVADVAAADLDALVKQGAVDPNPEAVAAASA